MRRPTLAGVAVAAAAGACAPGAPAPATTPDRDAAPAAAVPPPSSAVLALLPDGEEKRRLLLDCTACHQLDVALAFPGGEARSREAWHTAVARMLSFAGPASGFPVISAEHDARRSAAFLAEHLRDPPRDAPAPQPHPSAEVTEVDYPYAQDLPHDLIVDREGHVVVTGMFTHRMLRYDPATGGWDEVPIPVEGANPRALEIDARGDWWVLLGGPGKVARYRPATDPWSTWDIGLYGHSVRVDRAGRVWFNGHFTSDPPILGVVDPETSSVRRFPVPGHPAPEARHPVPYGLRIAPDGAVWGTELLGNRLLRFDPADETFRIWRMPTSHSGPRRPDVDAEGVVWIPQYAAGSLARFDPATETFREYPLPVGDALPYIARVDDARRRVWVATAAADAVLLFHPDAERFEVVPLPSRGALVRHIDVDARTGDLWVAYGASPGIAPKIARVRIPG